MEQYALQYPEVWEAILKYGSEIIFQTVTLSDLCTCDDEQATVEKVKSLLEDQAYRMGKWMLNAEKGLQNLRSRPDLLSQMLGAVTTGCCEFSDEIEFTFSLEPAKHIFEAMKYLHEIVFDPKQRYMIGMVLDKNYEEFFV